MNNSKLSSIGLIKILGCFIFDIALILGFLKTFGLFFIIAPSKSILVLFVLFTGLMMLNLVVAFSDMIFMRIGIPYSAAIVTLTILYVSVANILSVFLIAGSIVWYIVWELIMFSVFILIFSAIAAFSNESAKDIIKIENEQVGKASIMLQLMEIENAFNKKEDQKFISKCHKLFVILKQRIQASTPFGRIIGNSEVTKVEDQIKDNLTSLLANIKVDLTEKNLLQLQRLIEDTLKLVVNRETLNIH